MIKKNKLIAHFEKRETALKWLIGALAYCMLFCFIEDPRIKTISLIGKNRLILFTIYFIISAVAVTSNIFYMHKAFNLKGKTILYLTAASNLFFGFTVTTLMPPLSANGSITLFSTIVHWISGFGNILFNATAVLVCGLKTANEKSSRKLKCVTWIGAAICILDLLSFLLITLLSGGDMQKSKNGFFEIIPIAVALIELYIVNHTDIASKRKERDSLESQITATDESNFSSFCFGSLFFTWVILTLYSFVRNPIHYTISMTGIDYPIGFAIVCFAMAISFCCAFAKMFKAHNYKNYFSIAIAFIGCVSIIACVITPTTMGKNIDLVHVIGALVFFFFMMASIIFFLISQSRKNKKYRPFLIAFIVLFFAEIATLVILFIILKQQYGRTGLTELIPLELMFVFFFLENHTNYFSASSTKTKLFSSISIQ